MINSAHRAARITLSTLATAAIMLAAGCNQAAHDGPSAAPMMLTASGPKKPLVLEGVPISASDSTTSGGNPATTLVPLDWTNGAEKATLIITFDQESPLLNPLDFIDAPKGYLEYKDIRKPCTMARLVIPTKQNLNAAPGTKYKLQFHITNSDTAMPDPPGGSVTWSHPTDLQKNPE